MLNGFLLSVSVFSVECECLSVECESDCIRG